MKTDTIMEIIEQHPQRGKLWWYIDVKNFTCSMWGEKDESPSESMPPHAIANVKKRFFPKVGLS